MKYLLLKVLSKINELDLYINFIYSFNINVYNEVIQYN